MGLFNRMSREEREAYDKGKRERKEREFNEKAKAHVQRKQERIKRAYDSGRAGGSGSFKKNAKKMGEGLAKGLKQFGVAIAEAEKARLAREAKPRRGSKRSSSSKKKPKFVVIDGKAYPVAGVSRQKSKPRKRSKKQSQPNPFSFF